MKEKKQKKVQSSIVRDSLNTFGTNAIGAAITLVSAFLVLNRVNPSIKGLYNTVQLWGGGFSTVLGLSVNSAVTYYVARYKIQNAGATVKRLTLLLSAAITLVGAAVLLTMRGSQSFYETPLPYLLAILVYGVSSFILNICIAVLRGENKFKSYNSIVLLQRILVTALAVAVYIRPSAAVWVWGTNAIAVLMIVLSLYFILRWSGPMPQPAPEDDFPVPTGGVVKYSLKCHVSNMMNYLNQNLGSYVVQGSYGQANFGVYNTAMTMMQQVWILPDAVSQVIMSRIAGMREQSDKLKLTLISSKVVTYATAVTAVLLVWVANLFVPVIFPMYVGALDPLKYLIIGSVVISYAKVLNNSISAYGRPELNIIPTALGIAANLLFSVLLIPAMGINGVAVATSISLSLQGVSSIVIFCVFTKTPFYRLLVPSREELATLKNVIKR